MRGAMDSLYERLGARYLTAYAVVSLAASVACMPAAVEVYSLFVEVEPGEWLRLLAAEFVFFAIGCGWATWIYLREAGRIESWIADGRPPETAPETWDAAFGLPLYALRTASWRAALIVAVPLTIYAGWETDLGVGATVILYFGLLMAGLYPTLLNFFALELYLQPLLSDVARRLPPDFAPRHPRIRLRWKLLASVPLINLATGWFVSVFSNPGSSLTDLGAGAFVTVAVSLSVSLVLCLLFVESMLRPVEALVETTERVRSGDVSARARLLTDDEFGTLTSSLNQMLEGLEDRELLQDALGSYVAPEVASRVLEEGALLSPQRVEASIAFFDIRDFNAWSEGRQPEESLARLTDFFQLIVPIVASHGGHANAFLGGGLLAVFGAPTPHDDHADRALTAACEVANRVGERYGDELRIGIGVNSGEVLSGTVGGGGRLDFTVIGDPVNVASRVERLTRRTGDVVLITEATRSALRYSALKLTPRGELTVAGRMQPLRIYAVALPEVGSLRRVLEAA